MRRLTPQQTQAVLRAVGSQLGALDYDETETFRSPNADGIVYGQQAPGWTNKNSFAVYPFSLSNTSGTNGSVSIVPANPRRSFLLIQNQSTGSDMFFNFSGDAGLNVGVLLGPGVGVFFDVVCPYNSVALYVDSATPQPGALVEGAPLS